MAIDGVQKFKDPKTGVPMERYTDPQTGKDVVKKQWTDAGFSAPVTKTHTPVGVLGGTHMGGHSDVATPAPKAPAKKK
jgi:hypothetical protein